MTAGEIRELASFGAACLKLHLQVAGPLRNVDVNLCEDGRHALLLVEDGPDNWKGAEFELAEFVSDEAFDSYKYIDVFERRSPEQHSHELATGLCAARVQAEELLATINRCEQRLAADAKSAEDKRLTIA